MTLPSRWPAVLQAVMKANRARVPTATTRSGTRHR